MIFLIRNVWICLIPGQSQTRERLESKILCSTLCKYFIKMSTCASFVIPWEFIMQSIFTMPIFQSPYPDLYLLPVEENVNSLCSRSLSSDTVLYNTDSQTCYPPRPIFAPGQTKAPTKFPLIKQKPQQYFLAQSLENESSSSSLEEREEDSLGCEDSVWTEAHKMCWNVQEEFVAKEHGKYLCSGISN